MVYFNRNDKYDAIGAKYLKTYAKVFSCNTSAMLYVSTTVIGGKNGAQKFDQSNDSS